MAFAGKDDEIDRIPMEQIEFVKEFTDTIDESSKVLEATTKEDDGTWHMMQIATIPGGYNGGRSYYLRSNSSYTIENLITLLRKLSSKAREAADKSSLFWRIQRRVASVYEYDVVQSFIALLIAGVSAFKIQCICTFPR